MTNANSTSINLDNIDGVILLDKSGSMGEPVGVGSNPKMIRWDAGKESIEAFAEELAAHDDDGITVVPFAGSFEIIDGVTPDTVGKVYDNHTPGGGTQLAAPLSAIVEKFLPAKKKVTKSGGFLGMGGTSKVEYERISPKKAVFVGILTDGAASDEAEVIRVIADASKRITSRRDFGILFIQVGNDPAATRFLDRVNNGLEGGVADFDIVAVTKLEDLEDMSCEQIITLAYTA
ncbi:MAG: hypothetical protein KGS72_17585 [Cyanobacteria bacterium REEB67]|nr:hypothetical protein [Cyanobacteria bacterium REEB67]